MVEPSAHGLGRRALLAAVFTVALSGCGSSNDNVRINLPPPIESTKVGPGDIVVMEVFGEKELPREYQVASDGSIDIPYLHTVPVAGLEPQEIARRIRKLLMEKQILSDPSVVVRVKEYNSRRIMIMGQVAKPGVFSYTTGLTLIQALSQAGGPTGIANLDRVNLTRRIEGGSRTVVISIGPIMEGRSPDIPLQSGDRIFVHERLF
jgi:protein involved in polysaccharide export with SLBB domain